MSVGDELQRLQQLHESGALNDEEFAQAKAQLLAQPPQPSFTGNGIAPAAIEAQTRQWAMFIHLSQFAGFIIPLAGLVLPIVLWQVKKTELPGVDAHGKVVANWIISVLIYAVASVILAFLLIGIPMLIALVVMGIVFPIIGGIKANEGELWTYPLAIKFIS